MNEQRVTKQQAIRLKQAGYPTKHPFHVDINGNPFPEPEQIEIALSDAVRWLRDVKGWHVVALPVDLWNKWRVSIFYFEINGIPQKRRMPEERIDMATHDTALSAGIDAVLEQIEKEVGNG